MKVDHIFKTSSNKIEYSRGNIGYHVRAYLNTAEDGASVYFSLMDKPTDWVRVEAPLDANIADLIDAQFKTDALFYKELAKL